MIKLHINIDGAENYFEVPSSWSEVTVKMFDKIHNIERDGLSDLNLSIKTIAAITGVDEEIVGQLDFDSFGQLADALSFISEDIQTTEVEHIEVGDVKYYLKKDFDKLNVGEVASLELIMEKHKSNIVSAMPEMLCILLRQKKENGELESFKNEFMLRREIFEEVSIVDVNDLFVFFSDGGNSFPSNTQDSSRSQE